MKNYYYAVMRKQNNAECSDVLKVSGSLNLINVIQKLSNSGYIIVHQCETKKKAEEVANFWNECSLRNKRYAYENFRKPCVIAITI